MIQCVGEGRPGMLGIMARRRMGERACDGAARRQTEEARFFLDGFVGRAKLMPLLLGVAFLFERPSFWALK